MEMKAQEGELIKQHNEMLSLELKEREKMILFLSQKLEENEQSRLDLRQEVDAQKGFLMGVRNQLGYLKMVTSVLTEGRRVCV